MMNHSDLSSVSRSEALSKHIQSQTPLSFANFMELALYHPEWGYYTAENFSLGKHGDFVTAPELSPLFANCLARQLHQIAKVLRSSSLLEIGAGTGKLAADLLLALKNLGSLPDHYYIYEISERLRRKQQAFLQSTHPDFFSRFIWLDTLPENFHGTIIANEVLDAMPVHLFRIHPSGILEKYVATENNQFIFQYQQPDAEQLKVAQQIQTGYELPEGYEFEINFYLDAFMGSLAHSLKKGVILLSDYGYGQREYYHPERSAGTLTCFYQHQRHANPLILPGLQDITAHVDFTRVAESAVDNGLSLLGFTSQAAFLLAAGLTEMVAEEEKNLNEAEKVTLHQTVKILTMPTEMGERVKFMALGKHVELPLIGFQMQDRRREL